jgi:hypothetical protein
MPDVLTKNEWLELWRRWTTPRATRHVSVEPELYGKLLETARLYVKAHLTQEEIDTDTGALRAAMSAGAFDVKPPTKEAVVSAMRARFDREYDPMRDSGYRLMEVVIDIVFDTVAELAVPPRPTS